MLNMLYDIEILNSTQRGAVSDVTISGNDWVSLRRKKLFFVPEIHRAFVAGEIKQSDLVGGTGNNKVTHPVASDVCKLNPLSHDKATAAVARFGELKDQPFDTASEIRSAVFRVIHYDALFSNSAMVALGVTPVSLAAASGLHAKTIENFQNRGRITAYVAKTLLEAYQSLLATSTTALTPEAEAFRDADAKTYVTSSAREPLDGIVKDSYDEYLRHEADMQIAPQGWRNGNGQFRVRRRCGGAPLAQAAA